MKTFLITALFLSAFAAQAQSASESRMEQSSLRSQRGFSINPILGVAMFDIQGIDETKSDEGAVVGILFDIGTGPVAFQTGLTYMQLGAEAEADTGADVTFQLDYIGIPLAVKGYFQGTQQGLYAKAGVIPMINTRHEVEVEFAGRTFSDDVDDTSTFDTLAQVGLGFNTSSGGSADFGAELTFNRGLISVNEEGDEDFFNQGFLLTGFLRL